MKMMISLRKTDWDTLQSIASVECRTLREQAAKFVEDALKGAFKVYPKASKLFKVQVVQDLTFTIDQKLAAEPEDAYFARDNILGFSRFDGRNDHLSVIHLSGCEPSGRTFYVLEALEELAARFELEDER